MTSETQGTRTQTITNLKKKNVPIPFLTLVLLYFKTITDRTWSSSQL